MNIRKKFLAALLASTGVIAANSSGLTAFEENKKVVSMKDCEKRGQFVENDKLNTQNNPENFYNDHRALIEKNEQKIRKENEQLTRKDKSNHDSLMRNMYRIGKDPLPWHVQKILLTPIGPYDYRNKFPPGFQKIPNKTIGH